MIFRPAKKHQIFLLPSYLILIISFIFILNSQFLFDDWGSVLTASSSYKDSLNNWVNIWAIRPLSWVTIPAVIQLFGSNATLYFLLNSFLFLFSILLITKSLSILLGQNLRFVFLLVSLSPAIASTVLLSPVNQLETTLSFSLIAILSLIVSKCRLNRITAFLVFFTFSFLALLFYESLVGILVIPLFASYILCRRAFLYSLFGVIVSVFLVFLWQKLIVLQFVEEDFSRIKGFNLSAVASFMYAIAPGYFFNLLAAITLNVINFLVFLTLIASLTWGIKEIKKAPSHSRLSSPDVIKVSKVLVYFIILGALATGSLYFLSGLVADSSGYANRTLLAFNLLVGLFLWVILEKRQKFVITLLSSFLIASNLVWFFQVSIEGFRASNERIFQLNTLKTELELLPIGTASSELIFLDTPCFMPNNFSRVFLFCANWDLDSALRLRGYQGSPILLTNSSSTYLEKGSNLIMGGVKIPNHGSHLYSFNGDRIVYKGQFSAPTELFMRNRSLFTRVNLPEIEGKKNNCLLNGTLLSQNSTLLDNLNCLRDPFPLH